MTTTARLISLGQASRLIQSKGFTVGEAFGPHRLDREAPPPRLGGQI